MNIHVKNDLIGNFGFLNDFFLHVWKKKTIIYKFTFFLKINFYKNL